MLAIWTVLPVACLAANGQQIQRQTAPDYRCSVDLSSLTRQWDCGLDRKSHTDTLVGVILAVEASPSGETMLSIRPEEVFQGSVENPMMVNVPHAECFRRLTPGERWLFRLRRESQLQLVYLDWSRSNPVDKVQDELQILRELRDSKGRGILQGWVQWNFENDNRKYPGNLPVTATRKSDGASWMTRTDRRGFFEFQPLPAGEYRLEANDRGNFHAEAELASLGSGECRRVKIQNASHSKIQGQVRNKNGMPVPGAAVTIRSSDETVFATTTADGHGNYYFDNLIPSEYFIGLIAHPVGEQKLTDCGGVCVGKMPEISLYYGNSRTRAGAQSIAIAFGQELEGIDLIVPEP